MTNDELVQEFAHCVVQQNHAIDDGNSRLTNKFAKRITVALAALRANGVPGREALSALLDHDSDHVRVEAAACLLRHCHERARMVLLEVAARDGLVGFIAEQALERWADGTWALDLEET